jgi:hypothetical protein
MKKISCKDKKRYAFFFVLVAKRQKGIFGK